MEVDNILLDKAEQIVKQTKNFSPSFLQRKLAIGYNRASDMIDVIIEPYGLRLKLKTKQKIRLFSKNKRSFRVIEK